MLPKRPHVALVKGLIGIWVIGFAGSHAINLVAQFLYELREHLGDSSGTGGVFDAISIGAKGAAGAVERQWAGDLILTVLFIAAIVFLRSPVPKFLRSVIGGVNA